MRGLWNTSDFMWSRSTVRGFHTLAGCSSCVRTSKYSPYPNSTFCIALLEERKPVLLRICYGEAYCVHVRTRHCRVLTVGQAVPVPPMYGVATPASDAAPLIRELHLSLDGPPSKRP